MTLSSTKENCFKIRHSKSSHTQAYCKLAKAEESIEHGSGDGRKIESLYC